MKLIFKFTNTEKKLFLNMLNGKRVVNNTIENFPKYKDKIDKLMDDVIDKKNITSFYMDFEDFYNIKDENEAYSLQDKILLKPLLYLDYLNYYYTQYIASLYSDNILQYAPFYIRIRNVPINEIDYKNIGKLISLDVEIIQLEPKSIVLDVGKYQCSKCKSEYNVFQQYLEEQNIPECIVDKCINQKRPPRMMFLRDESSYINFQYGKAKIKDSDTIIHLFITNDLVNVLKKDDKLRISGILTVLNHLKVIKYEYKSIKLRKYKNIWKKKNINPSLEPILILNHYVEILDDLIT